MHRRLVREREALVRARRGLERRAPAAAIAEGRQRLLLLRGRLEAAGRAAVGDERDRLWHLWAGVDPNLDAYAGRRSTETPVVVLEPREAAGSPTASP